MNGSSTISTPNHNPAAATATRPTIATKIAAATPAIAGTAWNDVEDDDGTESLRSFDWRDRFTAEDLVERIEIENAHGAVDGILCRRAPRDESTHETRLARLAQNAERLLVGYKPKHSHGLLGKWRPVRCVETGQIFRSILAAAAAMGIHKSHLRRAVHNGTSAKGFHFEYADNEPAKEVA